MSIAFGRVCEREEELLILPDGDLGSCNKESREVDGA